MVESIMYFGIGFLFATIVAVALIPLVHSRAVRLTVRRLEHSIPQSMAEVQADKDALRAEFAMSTRRLEITIDELKNKYTNALTELGKMGDAVNRLKIEREAQKIEVAALEAEVVMLNDRLTAAGKEIEAVRSRIPADDVVSVVPKEWPVHEETQTGALVNDAADARASDQRIELAGDGTDVCARLQAAESSIRVSRRPSNFKNDRVARGRPSIGIRTSSNLARLVIAALISVGAAFAWHAEGTKEIIRRVSSLGSFLPMSTTKSPLDVDVAAKQPGSTSAHQVSAQDVELPQPASIIPTPPVPAAAAISPEHSAEPLTAKQEQLSDELQAVEQDIKQKTSSAPLQNSTTTAQSRPTPLEGWTLREVTNGTAVLEGPTGIWRVTRGDTLPGVGKVESYIRSNGQWVVATSSGLISMPVRQNTSSPPLQSDTKLTPTPEMNPKTIEGWTLREVTNGTAVLQGPTGILRVTLGDTVAGLGKVTAIVRWGKGWVVATSAGYCASAPPEHADGICKPYSGTPH